MGGGGIDVGNPLGGADPNAPCNTMNYVHKIYPTCLQPRIGEPLESGKFWWPDRDIQEICR